MPPKGRFINGVDSGGGGPAVSGMGALTSVGRPDGQKLEKNQCETCLKVLSCQSALKLHYRTHTGEPISEGLKRSVGV